MSVRGFAGSYVANGWSVLPIPLGAKAATIPWKDLQTTHPTAAQLDAWFGIHKANIGIVTGPVSDLVVLDFDQFEAIRALDAEIGGLPETRQVRTTRGTHLYFRYPAGRVIPTKAGVRPHVDVRGVGGYVVAPPSVSASGHVYAWVDESVPIVDLPADLLAILAPPPPEPLADMPAAPLPIHKGTRNSTLTRLAGTLLAQGADRTTVRDALFAANLSRCVPPLDAREVEAIVDSIAARERSKPKRVLRRTRLEDVVDEKIDWMWPGVLAKGLTVILDGAPGVGKSLLVYDLIARYTTGQVWPDGSPGGEIRPVLLVEPEDHIPTVVSPRLRAAGAAERLVEIIGIAGDSIKLPRDFAQLKEAIVDLQPGIVVLDPLTLLFESGRDDNKRGDLVELLAPMKQLAQDLGFCLIVVRHTKKDTTRGAASAGAGSFAGNSIARAVFLIGHHPRNKDLHVMAPTKVSLDRKRASLRFRIVDQAGVGRVVWDGTDDCTADDVATQSKPVPKQKQALDFLLGLLSESEDRSVREIKQAAVAEGIAERTVERALASSDFRNRIENGATDGMLRLRHDTKAA